MAGLYLHVPFCIRRCLYCDFYVEPLGTGPVSERLRTHHQIDNSAFLSALDIEFELRFGRLHWGAGDFAPTTIYVGGGTPTELSLADFERLFDLLHRWLDCSAAEEFTVEANPGTLTREKAELMLARGVNRISLGAQSFDDPTLEFLGRIHSAAETVEAVEMLRSLGLRNLNLDLLINLPETDLAHLDRDLDALLALEPEHCSCYTLDYEPNTHLTQLRDGGFVQELDENTSIEQYQGLRSRLAGAGLHQYELFNFCRDGFHSRHNQATWRGGEYLGFGPSAHSHWDGSRFGNAPHLTGWSMRLRGAKLPEVSRETLEPEAKARELLMTTLRQTEGVCSQWFEAQTGRSIAALLGEELEALLGEGLLEWTGATGASPSLRLPESAYYLSNFVFSRIL